MSTEDFLLGDKAESWNDDESDLDENEEKIEVIAENWDTVQVFKMSSWTIHLTPDGKIFHQDIPSSEILSTCTLLGIAEEHHTRILIGIIYHMVGPSRKFLNDRLGETEHKVRPPEQRR